ncbi:DNA-formamidopyrimidine glycosylase family protein [Danxiaibacter flavus]|uniref:DNA-formamidopyrimidine glycosylase family protein n=1 Tax=Danxiaibacter flavus TaxID=3049108 RepID=A0ABV3ZEB7_9BACT|nr:DNA-formamidopyrimidine glycosylase family protein [Chitinophagaceae bacterium DXS]
MPELPDLEVFSRNLTKHLKGKRIAKVVCNSKKLNVSPARLNKDLQDNTVKNFTREGKELYLNTREGNILALHLMLHGQLALSDNDEKPRHVILQLVFSDGSSLSLTDYQGAAKPTLNPDEKEAPDALDKKANAAYFSKEFTGKRTSVKNMLMDQSFIRGIGNAYADEILWKSGISPFSIAGKIPPDKIKALVKAIKSVVKQAEKQILKADPDIISGEIRDFLSVHNAKKSNTPTGTPIKKKATGGRKTYYTDEQKLYA